MFELFKDYLIIAVVLFCLCVGWILKNVIPSEKINSFIPIIVGVLGIFFNIWYEGWKVTPMIIIGGLFSGIASTGLYEAFSKMLSLLSDKIKLTSLSADEKTPDYTYTQGDKENIELSAETNDTDYKKTEIGFTRKNE